MLDTLIQRIKNGSISHAYCFVGSNQKALAGLSRITKVLSVNSYEIWRNEEEKISIEQVRQLEKWLAQKPLNGTYKIVFLSLNQINSQAITALLKTIEEPPSHGIIILSISNIRNVLATIKSRCQVIWVGEDDLQETSLNPLDVEFFTELTNILKEKSASSVLDEWLVNLRPNIRSGLRISWANELLRLKKYTKTNVNDKLLVENAFLAGLEDK